MATEKRLIDAGDLWSEIMMIPHNGDIISSEEVEQAIKEVHAVDAVEVVRCKDCKNFEHGGCGLTYGEFEPKAHDFCSYGERKDDGI